MTRLFIYRSPALPTPAQPAAPKVARAISAFASLTAALLLAANAHAQVLQYGDADLLGTGTYASSPTAGAALQGLVGGQTSLATLISPHAFPFSPSVADYAGTDTIYVGAAQTGSHDGYSTYANRVSGPQIISMDYLSLVTNPIETLTLGIAADDFQHPVFGQLFDVQINGIAYAPLAALLNSLNQTGPVVQFVSIGIPLAMLRMDGTLQLRINQSGDGGDGWAIDFVTIGVTTVPAPSAAALACLSGLLAFRRRG